MVRILLVLVLLAVVATMCAPPANQPSLISATGHIRYLPIEGGFYGIVAEDSTKYDPVNLPEGLRGDGFRVRFRARLLTDRVSTHQWGQLIEIVEIERAP